MLNRPVKGPKAMGMREKLEHDKKRAEKIKAQYEKRKWLCERNELWILRSLFLELFWKSKGIHTTQKTCEPKVHASHGKTTFQKAV
jgi:hypothetical protein